MTPAAARRRGTLPVRGALAVLGGLVTETAFPDRGWWFMAILGVALFAIALERTESLRSSMAVGTLWGLGFFLPHVWWAQVAVGPVPWVGLASLEAALVGVGAVLWVLARRSPWLAGARVGGTAVSFALIWVTVEQLRQVFPFGGFPWGRLAFSQTDGPLLRLASVGGAPLVSGVVAVAGFLLAAAITAALARRRGAWLRVAAAAGVVALVTVGGALVPAPTAAETGTLRVGAVQGDVATPGLGAFDRAREVLGNHAEGTARLLSRPEAADLDLLVWPENAADINPREDEEAAAVVDAAARAAGTPLLLGTDRLEDGRRYNDMIVWSAGQGAVASYSKQIPVPFAEYIPLRAVARLFSPAVDRVRTDMAPGTGVGLLPVDISRLNRPVPVATAICFEVAYDALIRRSILDGGEVLVVPTNNASFGLTSESTQQLAMSRFRAVEHGRAVLQVSTVGVSAVIAPDGSLVQRTGLFTAEEMLADVPLRTTLTLSDRLGDVPVVAITALAALLVLSGAVATLRRSRRAGRPATGSVVARAAAEPGEAARTPGLDRTFTPATGRLETDGGGSSSAGASAGNP